VLAAEDRSTAKLAPVGGNDLADAGRFDPAAGAGTVLSPTPPGGGPLQARFSIGAKPAGK